MPNSYCYSAWSYLDEWMTIDRPCHQALGSTLHKEQGSKDEAAKQLQRFVVHYGVARNLATTTGEATRLSLAVESLHRQECPTETDVVQRVEEFASWLGMTYKSQNGAPKILYSAASKLLWVRFGDPVVIYDSIVANQLGESRSNRATYRSFRAKWLQEYSKHEAPIRDACAGLVNLKQYTWESGLVNEEITSVTSSDWFKHRVFDHYMLNGYIRLEAVPTKRVAGDPRSIEV